MPTVLVTAKYSPDQLAPLQGVADILLGTDTEALTPRARALELLPQADGVITYGELRIDAEALDRAPKLKIVANTAIGTDNLDGKLMAARGVWAVNAPDAYTEATADATLGLLLATVRKIALGDRFVRSGQWSQVRPDRWEGMLLSGKTLGLVGYGKIGKAVQRRAEACGMKVIYFRASPATGPEPQRRELDALLAEADIVSLHVPLTAQTNKLIDARRLAQMKPGAVLVNMARGRVVDEAALVAALESGHLAGAGLDVFENEPVVTPALLKMDQVVMTPHLGGGTRESRRTARLLAAQNIALVLQGKRPLTPVNEVAKTRA